MAIPRNQPGNRCVIQELSIQEGHINNNNPKNDVDIPARIMNGREKPNLLLVNRNQNADEVLANMQQNQMLQGQNGPNRGLGLEAIKNSQSNQMIEHALNNHGFEVGNAQPPYFVSVFLYYILQSELPRGYKVPKFLKFAGELEESIVEHVVYFQIACGDLAIVEFLKMKYFPSSLTKNAFTWFTTLPPNSIIDLGTTRKSVP